jgi:DNA-directed RNA polymerase specialized sigma24 family protein
MTAPDAPARTPDPLTAALEDVVTVAVARALAEHRPRYAVSYEEAAERLSCSTRTITTLVAEGRLALVPHTRSVSVASLIRLADEPGS